MNRWWHRIRGKEDPYQMVGEVNDRTVKATSDYVWALRDISFDVKQGEVLGIIGRNGAGKSTLLKILSRTTAPTSGRIRMKGRVASLLEVGTGFHPELTGRENIFLNGAILGMTRAEISRKFDEIIDFAGVERYIDTPVKRYSSGMYVRLAFAVAAHLEPEILIVDEVLAVGDSEFQKKCLGKMKDVSDREGRTVLFVSHNMAAVKQLCNRGVMLSEGTISHSNDIDSLLDSYLVNSNTDARYLAVADEKKEGQFLEIRLFNEKGKLTNSFSGGSNPFILIDYCVNKDYDKFNVGMILTNSLENHIYSSADTDANTELLERKKKGSYSVKVPLPLFNLNTGVYKLRFLIGIMNTRVFDEVELFFSIENNNYINTGIRRGMLVTINRWEY
jgi:lipopolysaccharide transport system ATP-binding protein